MLRDIESNIENSKNTENWNFEILWIFLLVSDNQFNPTLGRLNLTWCKDTYRGLTRSEI